MNTDFGPFPFTDANGVLTQAAREWIATLVRELEAAKARIAALEAA